MGKNKTLKIAQTKEMENILEFPKHIKGKWQEHFGNTRPIILELACGKGHYTLGLGRANPNNNYIGIDIKGPRLWKGGKTALDEGLTNVRFIRMMIDHIEEYFEKGEVDEIWITFPDPQPKKERKRLTHPIFLARYKNVLKPGGIIHLKTDNTPLFEFTIGVLSGGGHPISKQTRNLYASQLYEDEALRIKTHYEALFVSEGENIKYCCFTI